MYSGLGGVSVSVLWGARRCRCGHPTWDVWGLPLGQEWTGATLQGVGDARENLWTLVFCCALLNTIIITTFDRAE